MIALKKAFTPALLLLCLSLTACYDLTKPPPPPPPPPPPTQVDFASDPSVLRNDWVAPLSGFPDNSRLVLADVVPTCQVGDENICELYRFKGTLRKDQEEAVPFVGEGNPGDTLIYTLTSPVEYAAPSIRANFALNNVDWVLTADFSSDPDGSSASYQGFICEAPTENLGCPNAFPVIFTPIAKSRPVLTTPSD